MEINGKYGTAVVYTDEIENEAISQIINLLNQPMAENAHVRIQPDCHSGAGCVIGYTAKLTDKIVPNLIGVDIGCGITAYSIGKLSEIGEGFDKLDAFIRKNIPSGMTTNERTSKEELEKVFNYYFNKNKKIRHFKDFSEQLNEVIERIGMKKQYIWNSIGSLGGGNHFCEIGKSSSGLIYFIVHSGSRNFGKQVAEWHQKIAMGSQLTVSREEYDTEISHIRETKKGKGIQVAIDAYRKTVVRRQPSGLEYLSGDLAESYYHDMDVAQIYAQLNRRVMIHRVMTGFYKQQYDESKIIESVHNYINFTDGIVRKGAISAHEGEQVIIPMNMARGCIIGFGKGNEEYNYSAPHGAGRKMSRSKAKETVSLDQFQKVMKQSGVWSSCIGKGTIDESPQAYKDPNKVIEFMKPTVEITDELKSIYNFKASEEPKKW